MSSAPRATGGSPNGFSGDAPGPREHPTRGRFWPPSKARVIDLDQGTLTPLGEAMPPVIRLHDLRHTHATLYLRVGVHPKIVSERLGHATTSITLDVHSHAMCDRAHPRRRCPMPVPDSIEYVNAIGTAGAALLAAFAIRQGNKQTEALREKRRIDHDLEGRACCRSTSFPSPERCTA
jgi:hypothetical protein